MIFEMFLRTAPDRPGLCRLDPHVTLLFLGLERRAALQSSLGIDLVKLIGFICFHIFIDSS